MTNAIRKKNRKARPALPRQNDLSGWHSDGAPWRLKDPKILNLKISSLILLCVLCDTFEYPSERQGRAGFAG